MGCIPMQVTTLLGLLGVLAVLGQDLQEKDALCNEAGCFVVYFQRKTFLQAWRSCRDYGGDLAVLKHQDEADAVEKLFSGVEMRGRPSQAKVWIGLQRHPRQCSSTRPLRGFSWVSGDQDTLYTNWQGEGSLSACNVPRCVAVQFSVDPLERHANLKWVDGPCSVTVEGYLCQYTYKGMCPSIANEGGGNSLYSTPFNLLTTELGHLPYGTVATIPCPEGTEEDQTVLCTDKEGYAVGWSREAPYCSSVHENKWCDRNNGGCEQLCIEDSASRFCMCIEGFALAPDGVSCLPHDTCHDSPCEFECLAVVEGFRCACPEGYVLEQDEHHCRDLDECLQVPCEHQCVNAPGTYECRCRDGYRPDENGDCEDVDECVDEPCQHACENTPGSHICHCHLGFSPVPEDPSRCQDTDECQIQGTCEQMCINYLGGFECHCEEGYNLLADNFSCGRIIVDHENPTATPAYPWGPSPPGDTWNFQHPPYQWPLTPADYDYYDHSEWMTDATTVDRGPTGVMGQTRAPPLELESTPHHEVIPPKAVDTTFASFALPPTLTPEWYEGDRTTLTPPPFFIEDDGHWFQSETVPSTPQDGGALDWFQPEQTLNPQQDGPASSPAQPSSPVEAEEVANAIVETVPPVTKPGSPSPPPGLGIEKPVPEEQQPGSSWLLVGLLVPLCIFVVVMVALGIVYCTRCTVRPQSKSTTDCYHWISGAADKAGAEHSGDVSKSHV
ncbi:CD248 molecule, endosialin a [Denticeps clupeoides]|uniref:CD248 molecule, endosialin a n=1 Tax=Denticeps clupeoides TaxID=299321 RepID=UPI0010A479AB|nr:endosialin-like [Denticeps clupeoides]